MEYKTLETTSDDQGRLYAKLSKTEVGDNVLIRLHKFNTANRKQVNYNGRNFESCSILCIHDGKEVYLNITPNIAKNLEDKNAKVGDTFVIHVGKPTSSFTKKAYFLNEFKLTEATPEEVAVAREIKDIAADKGVPLEEIDIKIVQETMSELGKSGNVENVYSAFIKE